MFLDPEKPIDKHRLNLPHWQQGETWLFVTWRLADSLPEHIVAKLKEQRISFDYLIRFLGARISQALRIVPQDRQSALANQLIRTLSESPSAWQDF